MQRLLIQCSFVIFEPYLLLIHYAYIVFFRFFNNFSTFLFNYNTIHYLHTLIHNYQNKLLIFTIDFAGFKEPNFGRKGRKAVSSQSSMIVYGIVAAIGVVILILVFSLISKSSSITTIRAENQGLNNQIDSMLQQKLKLAKDVNSLSGDRDKIKNEIKDKRDKETELDNQYKELQKKKDELNNELGQLNEQQAANEKQLTLLKDNSFMLAKTILKFPMDRQNTDKRKTSYQLRL